MQLFSICDLPWKWNASFFFFFFCLASQLSGVLIISVPGEIYVYGAIYSLTVLSMICAVLVINHLILPVFYENNIVNCFEVRHLFGIMIIRDDSYSYHHIPYHISTWNCDSISDWEDSTHCSLLSQFCCSFPLPSSCPLWSLLRVRHWHIYNQY